MKGSSRKNWLWVAAQIALLATLLVSPTGPRLMLLAPLQPVGTLLQGTGLARVAASALSPGGFRHLRLAVMLCLFFNAKARYEANLLMRKFSGYAAYARRTPRFLPALRMR